MKINDDHMYHGAALTQIAEHPQFTAINAFTKASGISRSAFKVNADIGVFLKYASRPKPPHGEYIFTFTSAHLKELRSIDKKCSKTYLALVCVRGRQICCLPYDTLQTLLARRAKAKGSTEAQYSVLVTAEAGKSFRVYMNAPGKKNTILGKELRTSRSSSSERSRRPTRPCRGPPTASSS